MTVHRVYESYHSDSDSGTYEYGTFSTLEKARDRMHEVWAKKGYPKDCQWSDDGCEFHGAWDGCYIYISHIELDVPRDEDYVGYT